jgi:hypothetical protein
MSHSVRATRVERSLYERANGYNYDAVKVFMPAGSKQPIVVHYTEHCPPDVGAAFIWLKNRDPDNWRDTQNVEHVLAKYIPCQLRTSTSARTEPECLPQKEILDNEIAVAWLASYRKGANRRGAH